MRLPDNHLHVKRAFTRADTIRGSNTPERVRSSGCGGLKFCVGHGQESRTNATA